jgi:hypothetical protein
MESAIGSAIKLVQKAVDVYNDFVALKEECEAFQEVLYAVLDVLTSIDRQYRNGDYGMQNTSLSRPLGMLEEGVKIGDGILHKCTKKRNGIKKIKPILLSKEYLAQLTSAKGKIFEAMELLQTCGVDIQGKLLRDINGVQTAVQDLDSKIINFKHEVADAVRAELHRGGDHMVTRIVAELSRHHIKVDCTQLLNEMKDIRNERDELFSAKVVADKQLIDGIVALSLGNEQLVSISSVSPLASGEVIWWHQKCIVCKKLCRKKVH